MLVVQVKKGTSCVIEFSLEGHTEVLSTGSKEIRVEFYGQVLTIKVTDDSEIISASEVSNG